MTTAGMFEMKQKPRKKGIKTLENCCGERETFHENFVNVFHDNFFLLIPF